jgi:hypothetical protein
MGIAEEFRSRSSAVDCLLQIDVLSVSFQQGVDQTFTDHEGICATVLFLRAVVGRIKTRLAKTEEGYDCLVFSGGFLSADCHKA